MDFNELEIKIPSLKKATKDFTKLTKVVNEANDALEVKKAVLKFEKISTLIDNEVSLIYIKHTQDVNNEEFNKAFDTINELMPSFSQLTINFYKAVLAKPFKEELERILGKHFLEVIENATLTFNESIMNDLVEESKLCSKYDEIVGNSEVKYNGQIYNLSSMSPFTTSKDPQVRYESSLAVSNFYEEKDNELGEIYDKLVKLRDSMAKKLGYNNFIELGYKSLGRTDYNSNDVVIYRKQIKEDVVPVCKKLINKKIKRIGIKNPDYYDLNIDFLTGNAAPKGNTKELISYAQKMYSDMSIETGNFFEFMVESNLMDLEARKGKIPGGYMSYLPLYKAPFIFSNFNGTSGDVDVLTHEFGHAFQGYMSSNIKFGELHMAGYETSEIHSMSMEFLAHPWMSLFFKEDTTKYIYSHIVDAITFLPYGALVDDFQHYVYENVNATHEERCAKWRELEKIYLPNKKYKKIKFLDKGKWWLRQGHIFSSPFYYIDYTIAQVVAFQIYSESLKNYDKALKKYVKLCKIGGKYPFLEILNRCHLKNPFIEGTIKKNLKPVLKELNKIDDTTL